MVFLQPDHVLPDGFDDALPSHAGADTHDRAAQDHQPHWDDHACDTGLPTAERHAEEQDADEFLAILRAVHETHGRGPDDLRIREEYVGAPAVKPRADQRHQLAHDPADAKSEQEAGRETIQHFDPLPHVDAADAILDGDGGAGKAGD